MKNFPNCRPFRPCRRPLNPWFPKRQLSHSDDLDLRCALCTERTESVQLLLVPTCDRSHQVKQKPHLNLMELSNWHAGFKLRTIRQLKLYWLNWKIQLYKLCIHCKIELSMKSEVKQDTQKNMFWEDCSRELPPAPLIWPVITRMRAPHGCWKSTPLASQFGFQVSQHPTTQMH
jgi:hypothetical protein